MAMPRVPTDLAELHGNPRKTGRAKPMPAPIGDLTKVPEQLTEGQAEYWNYAIANAPPGLLKRIDATALMTWVIASDLHRQAVIAQNKLGTLTVESPNGAMLLQSPYLAIINRQALLMLKSGSELGFSPCSRPKAYDEPRRYGRIETDHQAPPASRASLDEYLAEGGPLN